MSTPALALVPVLLAGTGTGANIGSDLPRGHCHRAVRETTDGNKESRGRGRFAGQQWPGAPLFSLSFHPTTFCQHEVAGGRPGAPRYQLSARS
jgi:hypothetical protein